MALLNLGLVTSSIISLIRESFRESPAWTPAPVPDILPEPPARLTGEGLCFYLYHVQENLAYKNLPSPGNDIPAVRYTPLALNLYYQLTANSLIELEPALQEQLMMGIAMKGLHDHPEISDATFIRGSQILHDHLRNSNNCFKISLLPVVHDEAVHNWTAGSASLKFSAYYLVTVVLFSPEDITSYARQVLTYGSLILTQGAPLIAGSENTIIVNIPGQANPQDIKISPAQVSSGGTVSFYGSGLMGDMVELFMYNDAWSEPALAEGNWNVNRRMDEIRATVRSRARQPQANNMVDLVPGVYSAQVQVVNAVTLANGNVRQVRSHSNRFPFTVTPLLTAVNGPDQNDVVDIRGEYFANVQVYIGGTALALVNNPPNPGEFQIVSSTHIDGRLPAGLPAGLILPIRVLVNGIEAAPQWITTN